MEKTTIPTLAAEKLGDKVSPEFVMLAARQTCDICNGLGAYFQPVIPVTKKGAREATPKGSGRITKETYRATKVCGCAFKRFAKRNHERLAFHETTKELHWRTDPAETVSVSLPTDGTIRVGA